MSEDLQKAVDQALQSYEFSKKHGRVSSLETMLYATLKRVRDENMVMTK